ncbi:major facilitator superfamily domain-containing protein [Spinellus fusiger]|nr:major facilitator superfamily domain-containing protein [Spinellus fusiger]
MNAFMGYFTSSIYLPATSAMKDEFKVDITTINATVSLFVFIIGIAPLYWAPLSERIGRRWVYTTGMLFYTIFTIVCALSPNVAVFFVFRLLQGVFACVGQAVGGGSAADLFLPHERGMAMSFYIVGTVLGPAVAPIIGGFVTQYLGWRWIFHIMSIMGGFLTIINFLFLKETLYTPHDPSDAPDNVSIFTKMKFNPLITLLLFKEPRVVWVCIPTSLAFGFFYLLVTVLPITFTSVYSFSTSSVGLCFLAGGIGNVIGCIFSGLVSDRLFSWQVKRNNNVRIPEYRLTPVYIGVPFSIVGILIYGWCLQFKVNSYVSLLGFGSYCFGIMYTITVISTYLVEILPKKSASVVSLANFSRNLVSMVFSLLAVIIDTGLGHGWTYTMIAIILLIAYLTCIPVVQRYAIKWGH